MPWNSSNNGVPKYAVIGGQDGTLMYFARHKILYDGRYRGTHIGRYKPGQDAWIPYSGEFHSFSEFEVSLCLKIIYEFNFKKIRFLRMQTINLSMEMKLEATP